MGANGEASIFMFLKRPSHHPMSLVTCRRVAAKTIFQMRQFHIENIQQDANLIVYVHPSQASRVSQAILRELSSLLFKFDEIFDGVVLAYDVDIPMLNKNHDFRKMNPLEKRLSKEQRYREAYKGIVFHSLIEYEVQKLEDHSHILQQLGTWRSVWIRRLIQQEPGRSDLEILGNVKGIEWAVQTNVHGNTTIRNSTSKGREERYTLRFDPSADFHKYNIFWTKNHIIFYVDDVPIRLFMRIKAIGNYFIASPMYVHGSIWDKSDWATDGGKQKVDYRYGSFTATSSKLILLRFPASTIDLKPIYNDEDPWEEKVPTGLTGSDITQMRRFRRKFMIYSYCFLDPPVTVQASFMSDFGILLPQRLKQLAQTITGSPPKNLGLDNSVSDAVKGVSLSSHLVDTLHATPPTPSPAPSPEPHDYTGPSPSPYANLSASYPSVLSPDTHHA
uniref:GH16 domain-containing protein n=1 Tax=Vitis vinifera TaxID=29760 RepID=A5AT65_VITVI|nr:hypothetical protein VITISV_001186 [Vitis vinifera]